MDRVQRQAIVTMLTTSTSSLSDQLHRYADGRAQGLTATYRRKIETCGPLEADTIVDDICTETTGAYQHMIDQIKARVAETEQTLDVMLRKADVDPDRLDLSPGTSAHNVIGATGASAFIADELLADVPITLMAGLGAAVATKGLFVAALNASLAGAVRPALFRTAMFGLGRTAFVAGLGGAAAGGAVGTVQAATASVFFGPIGWVVGGTITGASMYRSWRTAKRRNAQLVIDQACNGLRGAATEFRQALTEARDRVITALPEAG